METIGRAPTSHCISLGRNRWLHVKDWPGGGEPVVLLHGFLDSSAGWDDFARASRRRCVAIDLPGFGGSSAPDQPHLSAYAEDVVAGLRQLGIGSCTLVGHSMGGGVATVLAERMSTEVSSLLLIAPVGFGRLPLAELAVLPIVRTVTAAVMPRVLSKRLLVSTSAPTLSPTGPPCLSLSFSASPRDPVSIPACASRCRRSPPQVGHPRLSIVDALPTGSRCACCGENVMP
jgi:pimeloyl-ACP methyl ester carboxylesterase